MAAGVRQTTWPNSANRTAAFAVSDVKRSGERELSTAKTRMCSYQPDPVSYTHLRAHETDSYLVCRLLLEKKKKKKNRKKYCHTMTLVFFFFFNDTATTEIYTE